MFFQLYTSPCWSEDGQSCASEYLKDGDIIVKPDSSSTYRVGTDKDKLTGVYNINKGYAVFKQIKVLTSNDDYTIVEAKTPYGISLYDHIALDALIVYLTEHLNRFGFADCN